VIAWMCPKAKPLIKKSANIKTHDCMAVLEIMLGPMHCPRAMPYPTKKDFLEGKTSPYPYLARLFSAMTDQPVSVGIMEQCVPPISQGQRYSLNGESGGRLCCAVLCVMAGCLMRGSSNGAPALLPCPCQA
jgi:hypothetical protein